MKKLLCVLLSILMIMTTLVPMASAADNLDALSGTHPRVIYSQADFDAFKVAAASEELADVYTQLLASCDQIVQDGAPDYYEDSNLEDLWMRSIGDNIAKLAFGYKLSGKAEYKNALYSIVQKVNGYPSWGRGDFEDNDLAAAHLLRGISLYYDWLYNDLTDDEKSYVLNVLKVRGKNMAERTSWIGSVVESSGWWKKAYLQNHNWICASAIMDTAFAIYDSYDRAETWMTYCKDNFDKVFAYLPTDGALHEGIEYAGYSIGFLTEYADNAKKIYGTDYYQDGFLKNAGYFFANMLLPKSYDSGNPRDVLNFGDASSRLPGAGIISHLAYMANKNQDGELQWIVDKVRKNDSAQGDYWQMIATYDLDLDAVAPNETIKNDTLFESLGYAFMRTGYDDDADVVALRCGRAVSPLAPYGDTKYDVGTGHVHPDVNHFIIHSNGQKIITDDGYTKAYVANHNTLNIDGAGTYGEECDWEKPDGIDATPVITEFYSGDGYTFISADGTNAYKPEAKLEKFVRKMVYVKDKKVLLVLDDAKLQSGANKNMEVRFFPGVTFKDNLDNGVAFDNGISQMEILSLSDDNAAEYKNVSRTKDKSGNTESVGAYCVSSQTGTLLQPTAVVWADKGEALANVSIVEQTESYITFRVENGEDAQDNETYKVSLSSDIVEKSTGSASFNVEADYEENTLVLSGSFPFNNTVESEVTITDSSDETLFATTIENVGGVYNCEIPFEKLYEGTYTVNMHNSKLGSIMSKDITLAPQGGDVWVSACSLSEAGSTVTGTVSLKNTTGEGKKVNLIIVAYQGGRLVHAAMQPVDVGAEAQDSVVFSTDKEYDDLRLLVWETQLKPVIILN